MKQTFGSVAQAATVKSAAATASGAITSYFSKRTTTHRAKRGFNSTRAYVPLHALLVPTPQSITPPCYRNARYDTPSLLYSLDTDPSNYKAPHVTRSVASRSHEDVGS